MPDDIADDFTNDVASRPAGATVSNRLLAAGVVAGVVALLPFVVSPELDTARSAEVADHVLPSVVVLAAAGSVLAAQRRGRVGPMAFLGAGLAILLAGIWMATTHVPLLFQAARGDAPWFGSLYHSAAAAIVLGTGVAWASAAWTQAE